MNKLKYVVAFVLVTILTVIGIFYFKDYYFSKNFSGAAQSETILTSNLVLDTLQKYENEIKDYNLKPAKLKSIKSDKDTSLIIHFWASWCEPCINEIPDLIQFAKFNHQLKERAKIIIISQDYDEDSLNTFLKSFPELRSDIFFGLWDKDNAIVRDLNIDKLPVSIFINSGGELKKIDGVYHWKNLL